MFFASKAAKPSAEGSDTLLLVGIMKGKKVLSFNSFNSLNSLNSKKVSECET